MRPVIVGAGSFVPDGRVTNEQYLGALRPVNPKTRQLVDPAWLERAFGIKTRAYDANFPEAVKKSREEGGLYDGDLAVRAARVALVNAGVKSAEIDVVVHVSCTPDTLYVGDHFRHLDWELGLRSDAHLIHHNLGCAGLAAGLRTVRDSLSADSGATTVLLIASNCPSGYLSPETLEAYRRHPNKWAWLSPAVFGDGAGALVLRRSDEKSDGRGFIHSWYETHPEIQLVGYPAGGCLHHTVQANAGQHLFLMDPIAVGTQFVRLMRRNWARLLDDWPEKIMPALGHSFDPKQVARWYMHQANGPAVRQTAQALGIPVERAPINIVEYGNTSAASTLLLLDSDLRQGLVEEGDLVVFLWIGAGNGAMNGYAVCVL